MPDALRQRLEAKAGLPQPDPSFAKPGDARSLPAPSANSTRPFRPQIQASLPWEHPVQLLSFAVCQPAEDPSSHSRSDRGPSWKSRRDSPIHPDPSLSRNVYRALAEPMTSMCLLNTEVKGNTSMPPPIRASSTSPE